MIPLPKFFFEPSEDLFRDLSATISQLPIVSEREVLEALGESYKDWLSRGNYRETMSDLRDALQKDFEANLSEAEEAPWSFDYVIERSPYVPEDFAVNGVCVHTRLLKAYPDEGGVFYGPQIFRVGDDQFLYWIDSESD